MRARGTGAYVRYERASRWRETDALQQNPSYPLTRRLARCLATGAAGLLVSRQLVTLAKADNLLGGALGRLRLWFGHLGPPPEAGHDRAGKGAVTTKARRGAYLRRATAVPSARRSPARAARPRPQAQALTCQRDGFIFDGMGLMQIRNVPENVHRL